MTEDSEDKRHENYPDEWMIRPCFFYKDELRECTSIRGRFQQYFVYGQMIPCNQWKQDFKDCQLWISQESEEAYQRLVESEKNRRLQRLKPHYSNDVWKKRTQPPEGWNKPLPGWMQEKFENTYLNIMNEKAKSGATNLETVRTLCAIL